jgi:hypothetical protein
MNFVGTAELKQTSNDPHKVYENKDDLLHNL